jgi:hypothetical protein
MREDRRPSTDSPYLILLPLEQYPPEWRNDPTIIRVLHSRDYILTERVAPFSVEPGGPKSIDPTVFRAVDVYMQPEKLRKAGRGASITAETLHALRTQAGLGGWTMLDVVLADTEAMVATPAVRRQVFLVRPGVLPFLDTVPARGTEARLS